MLSVAGTPPLLTTKVGLRVVLVDDREERRRVVRLVLCASGLDLVDVVEADGGTTALHVIEADGADVVILEIQIPGSLELIRVLRERYPALVIVVCSFHTSPATKQLALQAGADSYLDKPVQREDLHRAIVSPHTPR
jgi:DNA-binding NarL/FixJ family response regulator